MSWIDIAGIALSALAALTLVGLIAHSLTTHWLGARGSTRAGPRAGVMARWTWPAVLAISFFVGFYGLPLRRVVHLTSASSGTIRQTTEARDEAGRPVDRRLYTVRAPFYVHQRTDEHPPGAPWRTTERVSVLQLPWLFLGVSAAYLLFGRGRRPPRFGVGRRRSGRGGLSLV